MRLISEYAALRVTCPKPGETLTIPTIKVNYDFGPFGVNEFSWAIYGVRLLYQYRPRGLLPATAMKLKRNCSSI